MTFDDLVEQWKQQERQLGTMLRLNVAHMREAHFDRMTSALDSVRRAIWIELLLDVVALLWIGSFLGDHIRDVRYAVPAAILHLCAIAHLGACIRQLLAARRVDHAAPVVEAQRRLTLLRQLRIRTSKWTLLLAPAAWTPLFLVATKGVLGVDAYAVFSSRWIAANALFSVAAIAIVVFATRRYGDRLSRTPLLQRLADDLAGRSLNEASAFAARLAEFER